MRSSHSLDRLDTAFDDPRLVADAGLLLVLGFTAKAASTPGTFLRSFRWGHVRQLDRVSRELLARAWSAGAIRDVSEAGPC